MVSCFRLAVLVGTLALAACTGHYPRYAVPAGAVETGFYDDPTAPAQALLEYRLAEYFATEPRRYGTVCAAASDAYAVDRQREPAPLAPTVEARLLARFPGLSPLTRCVKDGIDVRDAQTGAAAAIFDVHELACENPETCTAWAGYYANGPHGWRWFTLDFKNGSWRFARKEMDIVLTGDRE